MNHDIKTPLTTVKGYIDMQTRGRQVPAEIQGILARTLTKLDELVTETSIRLATIFYQEEITLPVLMDKIIFNLKAQLPKIKRTPVPQAPVLNLMFDRYLAESLGINAGLNIADVLITAGQTITEDMSVLINYEIAKDASGRSIVRIFIDDPGPGYPENILKEGFGVGVSGTREKLLQNPELAEKVSGGTGTAYGRLRERIEQHGGAFYPAKGPNGGRTVLKLPIITEGK